MGCDIHLTVERLVGERWVCVGTLNHGLHDYHGNLVEDAGDDGHSHSWLTLDEALPIFAETHHWGERDKAYQNGSREMLEFFFFGIDTPDHGKEHRIVFWFDN